MPYPTKPKGGWQQPRQVVVNNSTAQLRESKATRKFLNKYHKVFQTSMAQGSNNPPGPFLYQEDGKTYASLPAEMLRNIQSSHLYQKMQKDCQAEGIEVPKTVMAKDPVAHMVTPQEYLQKVAAGQMPQMNNHEMFVELAAKNDQTKILLMEFRDVETPKVSLQTDTCDTLYVTKNTLTAYTIAIVQNAQALQYDQMHAALQTGRNQSSLETPLRAEELLTAHFNLAVLEDKTITHTSPDAKKSPDNMQDPDPSTSAPGDQTYVKIPSRYAENSATRRPHPTGAVAPTCRRDNRLVNVIPVGYESDDSWDNLSHNHDHTHMHNIVPLLTLRPWRNSACRGPEQQQFRQQSATNVRSGNAPYSRPWDNQLYGRRTHSQQALHARAYRKIQRRYPLQ